MASENNERDLKKGEKGHLTKLFNQEKKHWERDLNLYKSNFDNINQELETIKNNINDFRDYLINGKGDEEALKKTIEDEYKKVQEIKKNSEEKFKELENFYSNIFEDTSTNPSLENKFNKALNKIEKNLEEIDEKKDNLEQFYKKVFGGTDKDEKEIIGLKKELDIRKENLDKFEKEQKEKFETIFEKIESLLPNATSAGLAGAYDKQRNSYRNSILVWNWMFIISVLLIIGLSFLSIYNFSQGAFIVPESLEETFILFMTRLPFLLALFYLAFYSNKQQSENKRLEEEYSHKVSFASSFEGYKTQVENLDDENSSKILADLLEKIVSMTGENPSKTLYTKKDKKNKETSKE